MNQEWKYKQARLRVRSDFRSKPRRTAAGAAAAPASVCAPRGCSQVVGARTNSGSGRLWIWNLNFSGYPRLIVFKIDIQLSDLSVNPNWPQFLASTPILRKCWGLVTYINSGIFFPRGAGKERRERHRQIFGRPSAGDYVLPSILIRKPAIFINWGRKGALCT